MCDRAVFDPSLKRFVSVDRGHRFDEKEGHSSGDSSEEEEGNSWTGVSIVSQYSKLDSYIELNIREPSCFLE